MIDILEQRDGSVVLMVVDVAFTSIGLNYFTVVVLEVGEFSKKFVESGEIKNLKEIAEADIDKLRKVWRNKGHGLSLANSFLLVNFK